MASPPRIRAFTREDFPEAPEWFSAFLLPLNEFAGAVVNALSRRLTRSENLMAGEAVLTFTTKPAVADTFPIRLKPSLPGRTKHLWPTRLEVLEGEPISTPYSLTWEHSQSSEVLVSVQGLSAETKYRLTVAYE